MTTLVLKSVKQSYSPAPEIMDLMEAFRSIVNDCIKSGLKTGATSLKMLSCLSYGDLRIRHSSILSYYRLTAISMAAGILATKKKSERRGIQTKDPRLQKPILVSCYHFRIRRGCLLFSISKKIRKMEIPLTKHALRAIEGLEVRSFTLTPNSLSLTVRKKMDPYVPRSFVGIDRNASNVTCGNREKVLQFSLTRAEEISRTTMEIVRSFRRNDARIRKEISSKYGKRRKERVLQILHHVSKNIVEDAKNNQQALIFEDIRGIRNLYRKGNFQAKSFRGRMNSVPWNEIKRQIEYKARWEGVPVIQLTKEETRGTSKLCPTCGERLQEDRINKVHRRKLWCGSCERWLDRDTVAVMNISHRGWLRFVQSKEKGGAGEAMVQESCRDGVILKVDASKLINSVVLKPKN